MSLDQEESTVDSSTYDARIFPMLAVMISQLVGSALAQEPFFTAAFYSTQPNGSGPGAIFVIRHSHTVFVAKTATYDLRIMVVPTIVTDCAPFAAIIDFNSALAFPSTTHQPDCMEEIKQDDKIYHISF